MDARDQDLEPDWGVLFANSPNNPGWVDRLHAKGKLIFHVFAALAEFERNVIRERTQAGLVAARAPGGRKLSLDDKQKREIRALLKDPSITVKDVAKRYGVSRTTLYKAVGVITPKKAGSDGS